MKRQKTSHLRVCTAYPNAAGRGYYFRKLIDVITAIVKRYKEQDTWKKDTVFEKESFDLLQNILEEAGELTARVPYEELVTADFAKKAVQ